MWRSLNSNSTVFELRSFLTDSKFDECFKRFVVRCVFVGKIFFTTDFIYTESQRACFFLKFNLSHKLQLLNVQRNFCSLMCYTVLIWMPILLTLGNNIFLQSFNWPKPMHYIPTGKINASVRICIWQILKVRIRIRRMWILTSFITSLIYMYKTV